MSNRCKALVLSLIFAACWVPLAAQTYTLQAFSVPYIQNGDTVPLAINNRGAVVGYVHYLNSQTREPFTRGFKRDANGVFERPIDYPTTQTPMYTVATGINDSGVIVGYYKAPNHNNNPSGFFLNNGTFTDYFLSPPGKYTQILGINNRGDIVGNFPGVQGSGGHGFVSVNGMVTQFDYPGATRTIPGGIAADDTIVGLYYFPGTWGFIRGPAGQYAALQQIPGSRNSEAHGVNNAAHKIVGRYSDAQGNHGFVYDYITGVVTTVDWPDPNTFWTVVTGINSQGVIVGWAYLQDSLGNRLPTFGFIGTPQ